MSANLSKWAPWNWLRREQEARPLPVRRGGKEVTPLWRVHDEIDRVFDDFFRGFGLPSLWSMEDWPRLESPAILRPQIDISESKSGYEITVEVPGVEQNDLELSVHDGVLTIRGEKRQDKREESDRYHRIERSYGAFQRELNLPSDADADRIEASFRNGVVRIKVPRRADAQSSGRRIPITSA
ncbi:HSP20 family protein [Fontimonas thermophila]|uniref:HSP20 family protein n=1 Tax=Fontimonas thermophila TaxID=1076937 RepID=A0A1I2HMB8_9GAMM|nr:Hsp20/alpha crystallin family protein [Fontimonas thermophila]SFF30583.1 HSP20 family protein [Fontimonas thermophila]